MRRPQATKEEAMQAIQTSFSKYLILLFAFLYLSHHAQEVATPDFLDVLFAIATGQQLTGEVDQFGGVGESTHATVTVEVGAESHMVDRKP